MGTSDYRLIEYSPCKSWSLTFDWFSELNSRIAVIPSFMIVLRKLKGLFMVADFHSLIQAAGPCREHYPPKGWGYEFSFSAQPLRIKLLQSPEIKWHQHLMLRFRSWWLPTPCRLDSSGDTYLCVLYALLWLPDSWNMQIMASRNSHQTQELIEGRFTLWIYITWRW